MNKRKYVRLVLLGILSGCTLQVPSIAAESTLPNVLLIYVDDMGYNDLGCYGAQDPGIKTPNIDRLAADGIRFSNYFSACSVCSPSRGALLTGRYPQRNGLPVCPNDKPEHTDWYEHVGLPQSEITIAELLKPLGYATAAYGKWHLGDADKFAPRKQGFDEYIGRKHNFHVGKPGVWFHNEEPQGEIMFREAHQKLTDATIAFMKQQQASAKPFFIYLAHYLVHGPWSPNKEFCTPEEWASVQKRKGGMNPTALPAMVRELDHHVGLVLASLKELNIEKETLVIFASDNGPWLPAGSAHPLSGWKYTTMEGGIREPWIVRWPGIAEPGSQSSEPICSIDLFPTVAAAAGVEVDHQIDGINILPALKGGKLNRQSLYWHYPHYSNQGGFPGGAIREGNYKLLERYEDGRVHLYDLAQDIGEQNDLAAQQPERVEQMRKRLHDWYQSVDARFLRKKNGETPWRP